MKQIIIKYFRGQPLSDNEIIEFLQSYLDGIGRKYDGQHLTGILSLLKQGVFQLQNAMEESCSNFPSLQLYKIYNPQGQLLSYRIIELEG